MAKLRDRLLYGDVRNWPAPMPDDQDGDSIDGGFGVERRGDEVVITLGLIPPFQVPKDTAIKLAMLLLKQAGCDVIVNSVDRRLSASWGKLDG